MDSLNVSVFHCRRVVCACSAGTVGSFSNKPLSPKTTGTVLCNGAGMDYGPISANFASSASSEREHTQRRAESSL